MDISENGCCCGSCIWFRRSKGYCGHKPAGMNVCYAFTAAQNCPFYAHLGVRYYTATTISGSAVPTVNGWEVKRLA